MKINYFLLGLSLFLITLNSCKKNIGNEYNRFQSNDEYYNKVRLLYIERNYKKAEKYIGKVKINNDFVLYLQAQIYYKLKKYSDSLKVLNRIKNNSSIIEYVKVLKIENYSKLKNYKPITNMAKNMHFKNYFLKYKSYKLFGEAFNSFRNTKKAIFYYKHFFSAYNKFHNWKIKKFIGEDFDTNFINFLKLLINKNDVNLLVSITVNNFHNITKKNRLNILNLINKTVVNNIKKISKKNLLSLGKKWYYFGKHQTAEKIFKSIIARDSAPLEAYYFTALINKNNRQKFKKYINNIITLFNNSDKALYYIGKAYRIKGNRKKSKKFFEKLITNNHKNKYTRMAYLNLLSLYFNSDKYENLLFKAINTFPGSKYISKLLYLTALKKLNSNDYKNSLTFLNKLQNNKFYKNMSLFFKGKVYLKLKNNDKAYFYFNKYLKKSRLNFYTIQAGKYIKTIYKKSFKIDNKYTKYFTGGKVRKKIDNKIITGKYYKSIQNDSNFKLMTKFFNSGLTFEGKLQLYILKNKFKKNKTKLYLSLLKYFNNANIINEALNIRLILLKRLKQYNNLLFFDKTILQNFFPMYYSRQLDKLIKKYNLDKTYVYSLVYAESLFNQEATSIDNAIGLFQLIPSTAKLVAKKINYKNESFYHSLYNAHLGLRYLSELLKRFNNNYIFALGAYNAGGRRMKIWKQKYKYKSNCIECFIEQIPYTETRGYLKKILFLRTFYKMIDIPGDDA